MISSLYALFRTHKLRLVSMGLLFAVVIAMVSLVDQIITNIQSQIATQTKPIVGADMIIESRQPASGAIQQAIDTYILQHTGNKALQTVEFYTSLGQIDDPKLVKVKGIQEGYPLYGTLTVNYLSGGSTGVYIDPETYELIGKSDTIQLGETTLTIAGIITQQTNNGFNILDEGRTVLLPYDLVTQTKLTDFGSRVEYKILVQLKDESQGPKLKQQFEQLFGKETYSISLAANRVNQLDSIIQQLNQYTSIILIVTIILSLSIMSIATMTMTDRIKQAIAVMRILGLSKTNIRIICIALFGSMFVIACIVGYYGAYLGFHGIMGLEIAQEFKRYTNLWPKSILISILGFVMTCRVPLAYLVDSSPLYLLNSSALYINKKDVIIGQILFAIGTWAILTILIENIITAGIIVITMIVGVTIVYIGITRFFRFCHKKSQVLRKTHFSRFDSIRQTILPGNQTVLLVGSLLVSLLAFGVITSVSISFIERLRISSIDQPNVFVLNVRNQDIPIIQQLDTQARLYDNIATRIQKINTVPLLTHLREQGIQTGEQREFTREFNATTRTLDSSPIIAGEPLTGGAVSLDQSFAQRLGVQRGDVITIFIQGRSFDLIVTSFRKRISSGSEPFFYIQLDASQFAQAPRSRFRVTRTDDITTFKQKAVQNIGKHLSFINIEEIIILITSIAKKVIAIVLGSMVLIIILIVCSSIASNEASALFNQQSYKLYHILGQTKKQLITKARKLVLLYSTVIMLLLVPLMASIIGYIYSQSSLLVRSWNALRIIIGGVVISLGLMILSFVGFHRHIIKQL